MSDTNLTTSEIMCFEEVDFHLPRHSFPPKDLFGSHLKEVMMNTKNLHLGQSKPHQNVMGSQFDKMNHMNFVIINGSQLT
jgi:hypothetical protein